MNDAERCLSELLGELESPDYDMDCVERTCRDLGLKLADLSSAIPRVEFERIAVLHAALRELVARRRAEVEQALVSVLQARERCSRLTRPHDVRASVDLSA